MLIDAERIQAVFLAAAELADPTDRARFLDGACDGDAELRSRVEALLRAHDQPDSLLDHPAVAPHDPESATTRTVGREGDAATDDEPLTFLAPPTRPDSLGRLGHYEVLQVLGRGGFGIVFRAFDEMLQRVVALKVMAPQLAATSPARKRFLREARSSAQVRHENVVQVYEVAEQPLPYLAMEFIPGETLQQRLDRTGPLEVHEVLRVGRQIAEGLAAAHATDLIHRDIKPGNVLLEGGHHKVKITDFGLARAADDASISQSGIIAGTPMYMAPEQALGQTLDQRADLFSLGSVLYQMVAGRPPFRANGTLAVLKRVAEDKPRSIREIIPETPQWLCDIIAKLHAKDPADRYPSAREVADVLADCEAQLKANARLKDYSRIPRSKSTARRSSRWTWAAALLPILAGVVVIALKWPHPFGGQEATTGPIKPGSDQTPGLVEKKDTVRSVSAEPLTRTSAPSPWQPLLDANLTKWGKHEEGEPEAIKVLDNGKELVLRLKRERKTAYLWPKELFQDHHWRLEFQFPSKEAGEFLVVWAKGRFGFRLHSDGKVVAFHGKEAAVNRGILQAGTVVAKEALKDEFTPLGDADLEPAGTWNRLDVVRVGSSLALFVNGRFVGALTNVRWPEGGKETEFTGKDFTGTLEAYRGEVQMRKIEIRDISALPPELIEPGPWRSLFNGKDWAGWVYPGDAKAEEYGIVNADGGPAIAISDAKTGRLKHANTFDNYHLRLQFRKEGPAELNAWFGFIDSPDEKGGLGLCINKGRIYFLRGETCRYQQATIQGGQFKPGLLAEQRWFFKDLSLRPAGQWNDLEIVRQGDSGVVRLNGQLAGAFTAFRGGGEIAPEKSLLAFYANSGKLLLRGIQIRDITALPPEVLAASPFPPLDPGFDKGQFGKAAAPFTDADVQRMAALPAALQVEEVRKELIRRNPRFDGKVEHKIEDRVVTEFRIVTDKVTVIAPIRVFDALQVLECRGTYTNKPNGLLADLTPLEGMNLAGLTHLHLTNTKVTDAGMVYFKDCKNLTHLYLWRTNVTDAGLVHFQDCKALTSLNLAGTKVSDVGLAHFKDCKNLKYLYLERTQVGDAGLAHFKGMPLMVVCIDETGITDLTPLQGMPLEEIHLTPKNITKGLDILRDMKSLKTIGIAWRQTWPAAEFWERYDKGEFK